MGTLLLTTTVVRSSGRMCFCGVLVSILALKPALHVAVDLHRMLLDSNLLERLQPLQRCRQYIAPDG